LAARPRLSVNLEPKGAVGPLLEIPENVMTQKSAVKPKF
jgi:hypothetical protein